MQSEPIFKRDSKGKLRSWSYEVEGDKFRTIAGLVDGKKVVSGWTTCVPKSRDTAEEQAKFEAEASERHQLDREYRRTVEELDAASAPEGNMLFKPMLAKKPADFKKGLDEHLAGKIVLSQPKLDGFRCIIRKDGAWTREGQPIVSADHIRQLVQPIFDDYLHGPDIVLDGELYNHDMKDEFQTLSGLLKRGPKTPDDFAKLKSLVQFHMYDCYVPSEPKAGYVERLKRCHRMFNFLMEKNPQTKDNLVVVQSHIAPHTLTPAERTQKLGAHCAAYLADGYEGQMLRLNEPYENKRSASLIKIKQFEDIEVPLVDIQEGNGNWAGAAKRVVIRLEDGQTQEASIRGTYEENAKLLAEKDEWLDGKSQVTVRFFRRTDDNKLYLPVVIKWHKGGRSL